MSADPRRPSWENAAPVPLADDVDDMPAGSMIAHMGVPDLSRCRVFRPAMTEDGPTLHMNGSWDGDIELR